MSKKPSIGFEIPVPWSTAPLKIQATGFLAVIVVAIASVAAICIVRSI